MKVLDLITQQAVKMIFQPVFALDSNTVIGHEALARGPNKERPQDMLHESKRIGLLREFELQCIQKAVANAPEGMLFVNVQPMTLLYLLKKLDPLPATDQIVFEIVEAEELPCSYKKDFVRYVNRLKSRGYKVAIDDISSGFNRLELVHLLVPDFIKIDAPLTVGDFNSRVVLKSVVTMAKELNIKTIAEGIETHKQLDLVKNLGVEYGQGYFLGNSLSPNHLPDASVL